MEENGEIKWKKEKTANEKEDDVFNQLFYYL